MTQNFRKAPQTQLCGAALSLLLPLILLIGEQGGAQSAVVLGQRRGVDGVAQFLLERLDDALVLGNAAGPHYLGPDPPPVGRPPPAAGAARPETALRGPTLPAESRAVAPMALAMRATT